MFLRKNGAKGRRPETRLPPKDDGWTGSTGRSSWRSRLEEEVQMLENQLQREVNLHTVLTSATRSNTTPAFSSCHLPDKVQELLSTIATLENVVSRLEEDLISLHFCLDWERNLLKCPSDKCIQEPCSSHTHTFSENGHSPSNKFSRSHMCSQNLDAGLDQDQVASCSFYKISPCLKLDNALNVSYGTLWQHPNCLTEEMVRCIRTIFLRLSESSTFSSRSCVSSPVGHLARSCSPTFTESSLKFSPLPSSSNDTLSEITLDPYRVNWNEKRIPIGIYGSATEVSWMTVGKKELKYAAEALKRFRFLVEQLAKVNPARLSCTQRLAFWINLYNALIMHAYLAYGVPRNETKLFSLMQKASYIVGGRSVRAIDIEYVILKMKPPAHGRQIAMALDLQKFDSLEEHEKFSIDTQEPLSVFALSCGMHSSPAVRILTAGNINEELEQSFRDYIQSSVGINDKGKLVVPKLLHCFVKGVVEDSLVVDWICRFLSPEQVSVIQDFTSQQRKKQRLLGAISFIILPFDSRFRYLFLPDNVNSNLLKD